MRRKQRQKRALAKIEEKTRMYDKVISEYTTNNWAISLSKEDLKADMKPVSYRPHYGDTAQTREVHPYQSSSIQPALIMACP